jgi:hypothetical protein
MKLAQLKTHEINKLSNFVFILDTMEFKLSSVKDVIKAAKVMDSVTVAMNEQMKQVFYFY